MNNSGRFAIITPYYKEPREILERCIESVKRQTIGADHFMVSDGHPQDWLNNSSIRHVRLDVGHNDFGNTPRGVGALIAVSEGYDAIGFLDADNWYESDHVAQCCVAANSSSGTQADVVVASRRILLPDGTPTNAPEEGNHVDTNCYWLLPGAFHLVHYWLTMVPQVSPLCDRVFYRVIKANALTTCYTKSITVNYVGDYEVFYRGLGKTPPKGAKPTIDAIPIFNWVLSLDHQQQRLLNQRCGVDMLAWAKEIVTRTSPLRIGRNDPCPCGSGRRYNIVMGNFE